MILQVSYLVESDSLLLRSWWRGGERLYQHHLLAIDGQGLGVGHIDARKILLLLLLLFLLFELLLLLFDAVVETRQPRRPRSLGIDVGSSSGSAPSANPAS